MLAIFLRHLSKEGLRLVGVTLALDMPIDQYVNARLNGCTLTGAELVDAMFNRSRVTGCVMGAANLRGSFWLKAELTGLDLSQALMDGAQFDGCTFNDIVWPTTLPGMLRLHDCRGDLP